MKHVMIGDRRIGPGEPVFIVAELSANHLHDYDRAVAIVRAAKEAGADAIKLQTYTPDTMTIACDKEPFLIGKGTIWEGRNLHDLYGEAYTPWEWHRGLMDLAHEVGLMFFSTPFDATAVDFLEDLGVLVHKVASFELVDLPLLRKIGATGKPVIMSTGMSTLSEIDEAVTTLRDSGAGGIILLKCTSAYPSPPSSMNLRTIPHLAEAFGVPTGLSDHTLGTTVPVSAVALGACVIEKHVTLSRKDPGPDSSFSLEPHELKQLVDAVRITEAALGTVRYKTSVEEIPSRVFRRSLFCVESVAEGEAFTEHNVRCIRPGHGLAPRFLDQVLGRRASRAIDRGTPLAWDLLG